MAREGNSVPGTLSSVLPNQVSRSVSRLWGKLLEQIEQTRTARIR